ncbi:cilia- and flagella-associated protein 70 [Xylocopa sonorina]|uniref:cilia- and flagella-associated protein 70 n=1 Tax=Xylocopa sonorina TaxID=1818115 RepID=UPI00403B1E28
MKQHRICSSRLLLFIHPNTFFYRTSFVFLCFPSFRQLNRRDSHVGYRIFEFVKIFSKMEEWMRWQTTVDEKNIEITLHSIENIIRKEDITVSFIVEHNNIILGESNPVFIKRNFDEELSIHIIDFVVNLRVNLSDKNSFDSLVSTPALIKAIEHVGCEQEELSVDSKDESRKRSIFSTKTPPPITKILGICNVDFIPIILGEEKLTEKLILETSNFSFDGTSVSWQNLPRLTITISQDLIPFFQSIGTVNFLHITIESIYNPPESFTENSRYKAGTIAFIEDEVPTNIIFDHGVFTKYRDVERTKRWNTLRHVENRAQLSKYKLDCDFMGVKNEFKKQLDLAKMTCEDVPRIEWNSLNRCILREGGIKAMRNHITIHRYWPFQFEVIEETSASLTPATQLYQCYVDLSELLFPGNKSCRIVKQLYKYSPTDITEKVGLEQNIFVSEPPRKESKEKDKRSKTSKHTKSNQSEDETVPSTPVTTIGSEEPTVVVIEIELYEPLIPCRIDADYTHLIAEMIPEQERKQHYPYTADIAEAQYIHCVQKLAEVLTESYKDELTCFTQYLYKSGVYLTVRNTLKMKVPMLIDQKFELPRNLVDFNKSHDFIVSIYTYLVEKMHLALNTMVEGRFLTDLQDDADLKKMYFYANEAYELGDITGARVYYTKLIASNKNDPYLWTQYAIFLNKIGDRDSAKECSLEAIKLDRQYAIALLVQAIILFKNREYKEAEIFLKAIVDFHPRFFEAWAVLHLFYIRTEYYPGLDLTLRVAEKCMQDKTRTIMFDQEPLSWTSIHCPPDNVYMSVATFLLKLNFCEFAGIALAEEMSISNRSTHVLYYMAVEHYLCGRYEDALSHLEEIRCNYGMDYSVSSLMGHCYYKMGNIEKGLEYYEFARMLFDRPDNLHLVEIRLGYHYYDAGDFNRARRIFLHACKFSPSSLTWLGVGICCYELNQLHEAEASLAEANRIDNHNPEIWGYLCLLNLTLERYDEFSQCYAEMIKNNLKNRKLWLRITNLMKALNYAPPRSVESNDFLEDHSTEQSEEQFKN